MSYVDLDKVINVSGGGGGVYPGGENPVPYPVLSQRIGLFNKPNAWDTDSNGWFGLLNSSNNSINAQNANRNSQMAVATASGTGPLSVRVKSYDFSVNIDKVDSGQIKAALLRQGTTTFFKIDESNNRIINVKTSELTGNLNVGGGKSFVINSGGNKFLLYGGNIYALDNNYKILSYTPVDTYQGNVIDVKDNYIRTIHFDHTLFPTDISYFYIYLYSINNNGIKTLIDYKLINSIGPLGNSNGMSNIVSYQQNNSIVHISYNIARYVSMSGPNMSKFSYETINLNNINQVENIVIYSQNSRVGPWPNGIHVGGYDGVGMIIVQGNNNIIRVTSAGLSGTLGTYIYGSPNITARTGSLSLLTSFDNNIGTYNNIIKVGNNTLPGDTISNIYNNIIFVYEPTGSLSQDESFIGFITNNFVRQHGEEIVCKLNNTTIQTIKDSYLYNLSNNLFLTFNIPQQTIGQKNIEFKLEYNNIVQTPTKIGFGITGGNYTTPTLPTNNGMSSGSATTPWVAGTNASYIDLTLSTN